MGNPLRVIGLFWYSWKKGVKVVRLGHRMDEQPSLDLSRMTRYSDRRNETVLRVCDLVWNDPALRRIAEHHGVTYEQLPELVRLADRIAPGWEGGHYVPVSTFAYATSLDYFLRNRDRLDRGRYVHVAGQLYDYFGATPVPQTLKDPHAAPTAVASAAP